jgi:hypothetical protein
MPVQRQNPGLTMPVRQDPRAAVTYDANVVRNPPISKNPKMNQPRHNLTIRARLFGCELLWECGQTAKNIRNSSIGRKRASPSSNKPFDFPSPPSQPAILSLAVRRIGGCCFTAYDRLGVRTAFPAKGRTNPCTIERAIGHG